MKGVQEHNHWLSIAKNWILFVRDRAEARREQAKSGIYTREKIMELKISEKERQELLNLLKQTESEKEKAKAKAEDVLKEVLIDQQVVHSMMLKLKDLEEAKK